MVWLSNSNSSRLSSQKIFILCILAPTYTPLYFSKHWFALLEIFFLKKPWLVKTNCRWQTAKTIWSLKWLKIMLLLIFRWRNCYLLCIIWVYSIWNLIFSMAWPTSFLKGKHLKKCLHYKDLLRNFVKVGLEGYFTGNSLKVNRTIKHIRNMYNECLIQSKLVIIALRQLNTVKDKVKSVYWGSFQSSAIISYKNLCS